MERDITKSGIVFSLLFVDSHFVQTVQVSPVFLQVSVKSIVWICVVFFSLNWIAWFSDSITTGNLSHSVFPSLALLASCIGISVLLVPAVTAAVWYRFYCPTDPLLLLLYPISRYILRLAFDVTMKAWIKRFEGVRSTCCIAYELPFNVVKICSFLVC